jgi:hypothetical protein
MSALEKLDKYIEEKRPTADSHYIKLILEAICEGGIKTIFVEGALYEVYADRLETKE